MQLEAAGAGEGGAGAGRRAGKGGESPLRIPVIAGTGSRASTYRCAPPSVLGRRGAKRGKGGMSKFPRNVCQSVSSKLFAESFPATAPCDPNRVSRRAPHRKKGEQQHWTTKLGVSRPCVENRPAARPHYTKDRIIALAKPSRVENRFLLVTRPCPGWSFPRQAEGRAWTTTTGFAAGSSRPGSFRRSRA